MPVERKGAVEMQTLVLVASACHAHSAQMPHAPEPLPVVVPVRQPVRSVPNAPSMDYAWIVRHEAGVTDIVLGTVRVEIVGAEVTVAGDRPARDLGAAIPYAHGWLFASSDGSIFRGDGFTSALQRIGDFPCSARPQPITRGRLVFGDIPGSWWSTDGTEPLARLVLPGTAITVTFGTPLHGAAVLDDGRLAQSHDGGTTWHFVEGAPLAWDLAGTEEGLFVATESGLRVLAEDGTLQASDRTWQHVHLPAAVVARISEAVRRDSIEHAAGTCVAGWPRTNAEAILQGVSVVCRERPAVPALVGGPHWFPLQNDDHRAMGPVRALLDTAHEPAQITAAWRGRDAQGAWQTHTVTQSLPRVAAHIQVVLASGAPGAEPDPHRLQLMAASRGGLLVRHGGNEGSRWWLPIAGDARVIDTLIGPGDLLRPGEAASYRPQTEGGLVEWTHARVRAPWEAALPSPRYINGASYSIAPEVFLAREIRRDGSTTPRRVRLGVRGRLIAYGERDGQWGIVEIDPPAASPVRFLPGKGGVPVIVGSYADGMLQPCATTEDASATHVWQAAGMSVDGVNPAIEEGPPPYIGDFALADYEVSERGTCVRRIEGAQVQWAHNHERDFYTRLASQNSHAMVGTADDGVSVRALRCAAARVRP